MQGKAGDEPKGRSTHTMFYYFTPKLKLNLLKLFQKTIIGLYLCRGIFWSELDFTNDSIGLVK